ncbi:MAG: hypothetical protein HPY55_14770 [Firmicutes bacterium]|nr:hypothetical protein [Bacillota bacterium]
MFGMPWPVVFTFILTALGFIFSCFWSVNFESITDRWLWKDIKATEDQVNLGKEAGKQ